MKAEMVYPLELIDERILCKAIKDFSHIANITYAKAKKSYLILFKKCVCDADLVEKEFRNYLIDLANVREQQL